MTKASGFIPAAADVPCQDVWMVERIRATAMKAYKRLEQGGELKIVYPVRLYKDRLEIDYMASIPHAWVLTTLKKAEQAVREELIRERQRLAYDLVSMAEGHMTDEMIPAFDSMAVRYKDIYELLTASGLSFREIREGA